QNILRSLDEALDQTMEASGKSVPAFAIRDYAGVPGHDLWRSGDNVLADPNQDSNDLGWSEFPAQGDPKFPRYPHAPVFLRQARAISPGVDSILNGLPVTRVVKTVVADDANTDNGAEADPTPSILDGWGARERAGWEPKGDGAATEYVLFDGIPILFVH